MSRLPIKDIIKRYEDLTKELTQTSDTQELIKLSKKQKPLMEQRDLAVEIATLKTRIKDNQEMLDTLAANETEMAELTKEEIKNQQARLEEAESELLSYLSPTDPRDDHNIYLEIRAGAGGDESSLFAGDLAKAYSLMSQRLGFSFRIMSSSTNDLGGYKEVVIEIKGDSPFSWLKYERGVHRVQRVPSTEKQGRIHTSTVAVAVMPILEQNDDFKLDMSEVEIETTTSSGKGGQSVNTTYSAVKVKHTPTGIEAQSQDERNQLQNKDKALAVLASRVFDHYEQERLEKEASERKEQVGRMDRSEKIRTYNYPQDRVTDHRYSQSWNQLPSIMNGDIVDVIRDIKKIEAENVLNDLNEKS